MPSNLKRHTVKLKDPCDPAGNYNGFHPSVTVLPRGYIHKAGAAALECEIIWERDVEFVHSDGIRIYVDIFRPADTVDCPAVVSWSPYGKSNNDLPWAYKSDQLSMLQKEEGVDPAFWCKNGYAVIHPDARGAYMSEGVINFFGEREGKDIAELVEWVAAKEWCSGKVGMAGNSWLAICQWFGAAQCPPHLAAIAPWEGASDMHRENLVKGGIPNVAFPRQLISVRHGNEMDDMPTMAECYPLWNEYWEEKHAKLKRIEIPAYIVASYTNSMHTAGTFRGWREISSAEKWLRVHRSQEWPDFYTHQEDLMRFFDHFLKGLDNGWQDTPRVRISLLNPGGVDVMDRPENAFPPDGTEYKTMYLDANTGAMGEDVPERDGAARYNSEAIGGMAKFLWEFSESTEVVGYMKAELYVEAESAQDMDLFLLVEKEDADGNTLRWSDPGDPYTHVPFLGFEGRLRVSRRALSEELSTDDVPVQSFACDELIKPGQIVKVDIAIWPAGMVFEPGQKLVLKIMSRDPNPAQIHGNPCDGILTVNTGHHVIHTGRYCPSFLRVPFHR